MNIDSATTRRMTIAGLAFAAASLMVGCSAGGGSVSAPATKAKPVSATVSTTDAPAPAATVVPSTVTTAVPTTAAPAGNTNPAPKPPAPAPAPAPAPTPAPQTRAPLPVITSFWTPDSIDCHNGMHQTFSTNWTTTGASKVTISIDGPGIYKTYPANGSESLSFQCTSSHSFLLTAYGQNGKTATKLITLQPRNVQPADSDPLSEEETPGGGL